MSRMKASALLVGSIDAENVESVFKVCIDNGGDIFAALPDGELDIRSNWVMYLFATIYNLHPDLQTVVRPIKATGKPDWLPVGYEDNWVFRVKDGVTRLRYEKLGYADEAEKSYQIFCRLREEGDIPTNMRFQVSLPATESTFRWVFPEASDFDVLSEAYNEVIPREIERIVAVVPPSDLSIQWDVCWETVAVVAAERGVQLGISDYEPAGTPFARYVTDLGRLGDLIPGGALMGIHLCYGDMGHKHAIEPKDLSVVVGMANAAVVRINRPVDYFHMPVPRERDDDSYFEALHGLDIGDTKIFLGLVHYTDGVNGTLNRVATAKRHIVDFGIATECGLGRRPQEQIPELLRIHREVAARL